MKTVMRLFCAVVLLSIANFSLTSAEETGILPLLAAAAAPAVASMATDMLAKKDGAKAEGESDQPAAAVAAEKDGENKMTDAVSQTEGAVKDLSAAAGSSPAKKLLDKVKKSKKKAKKADKKKDKKKAKKDKKKAKGKAKKKGGKKGKKKGKKAKPAKTEGATEFFLF